MISLKYPELRAHLANHDVGLLTMRTDDNQLVLFLKLNKEMILAAKMSNGFKISFVPYEVNGEQFHALLCFFPDNQDEPLTLMNTFYDNDKSKDLIELFCQKNFQSYFFDEHNREMIAFNSTITEHNNFLVKSQSFKPGRESDHAPGMTFEEVNQWLFDTVNRNSQNTFDVTFTSEVYSAFSHVVDGTRIFSPAPGDMGLVHYSLERKEPGDQQELDIYLLLDKILPDARIYINPIREDTKKEFVDILAVDDTYTLLVQAKDSPNTEQSLKTTITRKRSKTLSHFKKAAEQMKGAINHQKKNPSLHLSGENQNYVVETGGSSVIGLIVVKELFEEDVEEYFSVLKSVFESTGVICLLLDYTELHLYSNKTTGESFFKTLEQLYAYSMSIQKFVRARFN